MRLYRGVAALLWLGGTVAAAQAKPVQPWAPDLCQAFARQVSDAIGMNVSASTGDSRSVVDDAPAGTACLFAGQATGLTQTFADTQNRLEGRVLKGWKAIPEIGGGGAGEMFQGYRAGDRQVIVMLTNEPPAGTCEDVVLADCKVPAQRWRWTFRAVAYRK